MVNPPVYFYFFFFFIIFLIFSFRLNNHFNHVNNDSYYFHTRLGLWVQTHSLWVAGEFFYSIFSLLKLLFKIRTSTMTTNNHDHMSSSSPIGRVNLSCRLTVFRQMTFFQLWRNRLLGIIISPRCKSLKKLVRSMTTTRRLLWSIEVYRSMVMVNYELEIIGCKGPFVNGSFTLHLHTALKDMMHEYWILCFLDSGEVGLELLRKCQKDKCWQSRDWYDDKVSG